MFRYFHGPQDDMAELTSGNEVCSLCGKSGRCFRLEAPICSGLSAALKESGLGCLSCLYSGRFEFWHDTEIGLLDANGLSHEYSHHRPPPANFRNGALIELRRTPQIVTWQQELWLTHCQDFMAYLGTWEPQDFYHNAPGGNGRALFEEMTDEEYRHLWGESLPEGADRLDSWHATYYAFRCLHCGKLRGNWDCD